MSPEVRLQGEQDRLRQGIQLLREEIRIKHAHMEQIEPHRRPHYPPTARPAILELRAARAWSLAQTARIFHVSCLTVASWMSRLDQDGPDALVRLPEPVNRFPEFVAYLVRRLNTLCPGLGKLPKAPSESSPLGAQIIFGTGPDDPSRGIGILDLLLSFRDAASLALLLVAGGCRRSLLPTRVGFAVYRRLPSSAAWPHSSTS